MLDPDKGKHIMGECPAAVEKRLTGRPALAQAVEQAIASTAV
jgi:hypothetical protein